MDTPITKRLLTDYQKVKALASSSGGSLIIRSTSGNPPSTYDLEFRCPSLVLGETGVPEIRMNHTVRIFLGADYPMSMPTAVMLTPIFNPHIYANNRFCLGTRWRPNETLDSLIMKIGAILQYDPKVLDFKSLANHRAGEWAKRNLAKLPIGRVSFKAAQTAKPRIEWKT